MYSVALHSSGRTYFLGSPFLWGKYESNPIVGKGNLSAWHRAVWVLVPAVTEFSGSTSCSAPADLGPIGSCSSSAEVWVQGGEETHRSCEKLGLGAALCTGRIGGLFPAGSVPRKPRVRSWGHF